MSLDPYLQLPHDAIDYTSLGDDVLIALATQDSEPYIATSALAELGARPSEGARVAAADILSRAMWDRHLMAFALTTLFERDRDAALASMSTLLAGAPDPKVVGAMVECIALDPVYFEVGAARDFASHLAERVRRGDVLLDEH
jgi:hypothetical protein